MKEPKGVDVRLSVGDRDAERMSLSQEQNSGMDVRLAFQVARCKPQDEALKNCGVDVRLAVSGNPKIGDEALKQNTKGVDVRCSLHPMNKNESAAVSVEHGGVDVRLAHCPGAQGDNSLIGERGVAPIPMERTPALLISFYYFNRWKERQAEYRYRDWAMDSGAYSAFNSGATIDLNEYIDCCLELKEADPTLVEVFALDVIGDPDASLKNAQKMCEQGVAAIPCYHEGEPESFLHDMAAEHPKVAIGGVANMIGPRKLKWAEQCFARIWPKRIHGFGFGAESQIMALPWDSVDATNWESGPCMFGRWNSFGALSVRGSKQNLRAEIEYYLRVEQKARRRWRKTMRQLND